MLIYFCLILLTLAGIALGTIPPSKFNLVTELSKNPVYLWSGSVKAFGVPLSLCLLRISKNTFVKLGTAIWGLFLTILSTLILFQISDLAPSANLYGTLFLSAITIVCFSTFLFSSLEIFALLPKPKPAPPSPPNTGESETEAPTNPS